MEKYEYGNEPTKEQIESAIDTLKIERFARWQTIMTQDEKSEIDSAHDLCIYLLGEMLEKQNEPEQEEQGGE